MTFEGENLLVGLFALALVPLIGRRILRGLRTGSLPLYRTYLDRREDEAKFFGLLALHILSALIMAFIAADLLLGLGLREKL